MHRFSACRAVKSLILFGKFYHQVITRLEDGRNRYEKVEKGRNRQEQVGTGRISGSHVLSAQSSQRLIFFANLISQLNLDQRKVRTDMKRQEQVETGRNRQEQILSTQSSQCLNFVWKFYQLFITRLEEGRNSQEKVGTGRNRQDLQNMLVIHRFNRWSYRPWSCFEKVLFVQFSLFCHHAHLIKLKKSWL